MEAADAAASRHLQRKFYRETLGQYLESEICFWVRQRHRSSELVTDKERQKAYQFLNDRLWRKAAVPNIGCVRCGTCYEIEMISRF
jgi:hypothetical protein